MPSILRKPLALYFDIILTQKGLTGPCDKAHNASAIPKKTHFLFRSSHQIFRALLVWYALMGLISLVLLAANDFMRTGIAYVWRDPLRMVGQFREVADIRQFFLEHPDLQEALLSPSSGNHDRALDIYEETNGRPWPNFLWIDRGNEGGYYISRGLGFHAYIWYNAELSEKYAMDRPGWWLKASEGSPTVHLAWEVFSKAPTHAPPT